MPERPQTPEPDVDPSTIAREATDESQQEVEPEQARSTEANEPPDPEDADAVQGTHKGDDRAETATESGPPDTEDPRPDADPDEVKTWAVQTGSFTREANAQDQRDRLQEAGFDAFIEAAEADNTAVWRVRVGPMAMEADARAIRQRLAAEHGLEPILVSHP